MPSELTTLVALLLRLLDQLAAWLEVAPREPTRWQRGIDLLLPVAVGAVFGLFGLGIGWKIQAQLREHDQIADAWDGPLTKLRIAVTNAQWSGHRLNPFAGYERRWSVVEPAQQTLFEVVSHRLGRFISPEINYARTWIEVERARNRTWLLATLGASEPERAILAFLARDPTQSASTFTEDAARESLLSAGFEITPGSIAQAMQQSTDALQWARLAELAQEHEVLAKQAQREWAIADMALTVASARGGPAPRLRWSMRWSLRRRHDIY